MIHDKFLAVENNTVLSRVAFVTGSRNIKNKFALVFYEFGFRANSIVCVSRNITSVTSRIIK